MKQVTISNIAGGDARIFPWDGHQLSECRCCGCLVAGGPTACVRCAKAGE